MRILNLTLSLVIMVVITYFLQHRHADGALRFHWMTVGMLMMYLTTLIQMLLEKK